MPELQLNSKGVIVRATALIAVISGLFGGFLFNISPPDYEGKLPPGFTHGVFSAIIMCVILVLWVYNAYFKNSISPQKWLISCFVLIGVFLISAIIYFYIYQSFTFLEPISSTESIRHIHGNSLTSFGKQWISDNPELGKSIMVFDFAYKIDVIWSDKSTEKMRFVFFIIYLIVSTSLASALVCLSEFICRADTNNITEN